MAIVIAIQIAKGEGSAFSWFLECLRSSYPQSLSRLRTPIIHSDDSEIHSWDRAVLVFRKVYLSDLSHSLLHDQAIDFWESRLLDPDERELLSEIDTCIRPLPPMSFPAGSSQLLSGTLVEKQISAQEEYRTTILSTLIRRPEVGINVLCPVPTSCFAREELPRSLDKSDVLTSASRHDIGAC